MLFRAAGIHAEVMSFLTPDANGQHPLMFEYAERHFLKEANPAPLFLAVS